MSVTSFSCSTWLVGIECKAVVPSYSLRWARYCLFTLICGWFPGQPDCISSPSDCDELTVVGKHRRQLFPVGNAGQGRAEESRQTLPDSVDSDMTVCLGLFHVRL